MKEVIQGLFWPKLSAMEQMSICSFLKNGYDYHLYAYGPVEGVPDGAIVKDANEIMPYQTYTHMAQFADHFRYKLLFERGGWWADMDVVCLKPFDFNAEYVFSSEEGNVDPRLNNVIVKAPAYSHIMKWMLEQCEQVDRSKMQYTTLGPELMQKAIAKFGLQEFVLSPVVFCPIPWWQANRYLENEKIADFPNSYAFHFWHEMWRRDKRPTNIFTGLYSELHSEYGWGRGKIFMGLVTCDKTKYQRLAKFCLNSWGKSIPEGFDLKVCTGSALGVADDYNSLQLKTKALVTYALEHGYEGTIKVDDDTFVRTDRLRVPAADYAGWTTLDGCQPTCSWSHCQGGFYWLSKRAMKVVAEASFYPKGEPRALSISEDSWVGWVLRDKGIRPQLLSDVVLNPSWEWARETERWRKGDVPNTPDWMALTQINEADFLRLCPELARLDLPPLPIVLLPPSPPPTIRRFGKRTIPFGIRHIGRRPRR
jgi:hypothetical protein